MPQGPGTYGSQKGRPKKKKSFIGPKRQTRLQKVKSKVKSTVTKAKSAVKKAKSKVEEPVSRIRLKRLAKKGKVSTVKGAKVKKSSYTRKSTKEKKKNYPGMEKVGKVAKGAKSAVHTKGGTYVKYKKDSKQLDHLDLHLKRVALGILKVLHGKAVNIVVQKNNA